MNKHVNMGGGKIVPLSGLNRELWGPITSEKERISLSQGWALLLLVIKYIVVSPETI